MTCNKFTGWPSLWAGARSSQGRESQKLPSRSVKLQIIRSFCQSALQQGIASLRSLRTEGDRVVETIRFLYKALHSRCQLRVAVAMVSVWNSSGKQNIRFVRLLCFFSFFSNVRTVLSLHQGKVSIHSQDKPPTVRSHRKRYCWVHTQDAEVLVLISFPPVQLLQSYVGDIKEQLHESFQGYSHAFKRQNQFQ